MRITRQRAASLASALLILTFGLAPAVDAADHLDSPAVAAQGSVDITDLYVFSTNHDNATAFILGVNPGAGALPNSGTTFGPGVEYRIKVDTNGDLKPDITYLYKFGSPNGMGVQSLKMWRNGVLYVNGSTDQTNFLPGGGRTTAGLYDDPFFFDLQAFRTTRSTGTLSFVNTRSFFTGQNDTSMVVEIPLAMIRGNGKLNIWGTTARFGGQK